MGPATEIILAVPQGSSTVLQQCGRSASALPDSTVVCVADLDRARKEAVVCSTQWASVWWQRACCNTHAGAPWGVKPAWAHRLAGQMCRVAHLRVGMQMESSRL